MTMGSPNSGAARPFYVIGHNPNTLARARVFIEAGANAIEPDINVRKSDSTKLCVSHDEGDDSAVAPEDFFKGLNRLASEYPHFSLVYLDCKPRTATPEHARSLLAAVRANLTVGDGSGLKILFSVPTISHAEQMFPAIASDLRDNEFLLIDEENDPAAVSRCFRRMGIIQNQCYGNGDSVPLLPTEEFFPHVESSLKQACDLRRSGYGIGWVVAWTFNTTANQRRLIDLGVDGIIVDVPSFPYPNGLGNLAAIVASGAGVRIAVKDDSLVSPARQLSGARSY